MNHNENEGSYHGTNAYERTRYGKRSIAVAQRELDAARFVGGDISATEIERRYQAALRKIRQRRARNDWP